MTTIAEILVKEPKLDENGNVIQNQYGDIEYTFPNSWKTIKATVTGVSKRTTGSGYNLTDLELSDGTGNAKMTLFNAQMEFEIGDIIQATQVYPKIFKKEISLNMSKKGNISVIGKDKDTFGHMTGTTAGYGDAPLTKTPAPASKPAEKTRGKILDGLIQSGQAGKLVDAVDNLAKWLKELKDEMVKTRQDAHMDHLELIGKLEQLHVAFLRQIRDMSSIPEIPTGEPDEPAGPDEAG